MNVIAILENYIKSEVEYQLDPNKDNRSTTEQNLSLLYNKFKKASECLDREELEELINKINDKINDLESQTNEQSTQLQLEFYKYFCQVELEPKLKGSKRI